jgi:hypothetical protein
MFYRPMRAAITDRLQAGVLTGMWHLITIHFTLSALALLALGAYGRQDWLAALVALQFAGYALTYLILSSRLGGPLVLFQWLPFGATAILAALGALPGG